VSSPPFPRCRYHAELAGAPIPAFSGSSPLHGRQLVARARFHMLSSFSPAPLQEDEHEWRSGRCGLIGGARLSRSGGSRHDIDPTVTVNGAPADPVCREGGHP